jgi:anti-sigma-K factor RskA
VDLSCIISSGDLELYVLGMLPADESEKLTVLAGLFPEIKEEIDRISETLRSVGNAAEVQPSSHIKGELMQKLAALKEPVIASSSAPIIEMRPVQSSNRSWPAAASVAAVLFAAGFIYLLNINRDQKALVSDQERRIASLEKTVVSKDDVLRESQVMLDMFRNEEFRKINLKQMPGASPAEVEIFWSTKTNEVYVGGIRLPEAPSGKQYQLWAIVNGKPVDAGLISKGQLQKMKTFDKAEAFAITLENEGGSPTPTMEAMIVMANT